MSAMPYGIRAQANQALTLNEVAAAVPSLFAEAPHASRSDRYVFLSSIDMLRAIMQQGFDIVEARQGRVRDASRRDYTKHMVRLRQHSAPTTARAVGDTSFEVVMRNASDGTMGYHFDAGLFRLVCLNGMTVSDGMFASVHVRHSGNRERIVNEMLEGVFSVVKAAPKVLEAPRAWSQIELNRDERIALAESARVVRFGDSDGNVDTPIAASQLLIPRRPADTGNDLWRTFNVLQENTVRGGVSAMGRDANNRPRRTTTREVRGIDQDVKLNKALWMLADQMSKLKGVQLAA